MTAAKRLVGFWGGNPPPSRTISVILLLPPCPGVRGTLLPGSAQTSHSVGRGLSGEGGGLVRF